MSDSADLDHQITELQELRAHIDDVFEGIPPEVRDQILHDLIARQDEDAEEHTLRVIAVHLASYKRSA
jgi:hypothetical protein